MSYKDKKIHQFIVESSLFKGHYDWYYCFLKSERIAHVLLLLTEKTSREYRKSLIELYENAATLPSTIAHLAADEVGLRQVLAKVFSLIVSIKFLVTSNLLNQETGYILTNEYEMLAEKLDTSARLSPFITSQDFIIQPMDEKLPQLSENSEQSQRSIYIKDKHKGHYSDINNGHKRHSQRLDTILSFIKSKKNVSIKDICRMTDPIIRNCSEKTIQRELTKLIGQGLVKKMGERRWSVYEAV